MTDPLIPLRKRAMALRRAHAAADPEALARAAAHVTRDGPLLHADALHVVAREEGHASWPALKAATEVAALDAAGRLERLGHALFHGQTEVAVRLLEADPELGRGDFGLAVALLRVEEVAGMLERDPGLAIRATGPFLPMVQLGQSRMHRVLPEGEARSLALAELLLAHGADPNAAFAGPDGPLSALFFALTRSRNLALARWLLDHGADPDDGESLYHATEMGGTEGLELLLSRGARPGGTNALLRAIDMDDAAMVRLLLDAGAGPDEDRGRDEGGGPSSLIPALHQAARRHASPGICRMLLDAGADPRRAFHGLSPHLVARLFGHEALVRLLEDRGAATEVPSEVRPLLDAAEGREGGRVDPARLPPVLRHLLQDLIPLPGQLARIERLVAKGLETDLPDGEGVTPVQRAGWCGLPDVMEFLLRQKPDLSHRNRYGGTLLTTILHGAENAPPLPGQDHAACLRRVLEEGVALPRQAIARGGDDELGELLRDWARERPGQVVD